MASVVPTRQKYGPARVANSQANNDSNNNNCNSNADDRDDTSNDKNTIMIVVLIVKVVIISFNKLVPITVITIMIGVTVVRDICQTWLSNLLGLIP